MDVDPGHKWFGKLFPCVCKDKVITTAMQEQLGSRLQPNTFVDFIVSNDITDTMLKQAKGFVQGFYNLYTVYGANGTGKTTILMAITNEFLNAGTRAVYLTAYDAIEYVKAGFGLDFGADARISKISNLPILLLDELSQVRWSEYNAETLEAILDRRHRADRPTGLALDQDPEEVLSPRFASRLTSGSFIKVSGEDWRPDLGKAAMERAERGSVMERGE